MWQNKQLRAIDFDDARSRLTHKLARDKMKIKCFEHSLKQLDLQKTKHLIEGDIFSPPFFSIYPVTECHLGDELVDLFGE